MLQWCRQNRAYGAATRPIVKVESMPAPDKLNIARTLAAYLLGLTLLAPLLAGCSMREEMKRIQAMKQAREASESSRSTNLTGEQIYIRSCNTCHQSTGRRNVGPNLADLEDKFHSDEEIVAFLRKGKGMMPAQPPTTINDKEMENLVEYLHRLSAELKEQQEKK
jgi:mono/diheme cytochrome c family protein